jgi:hypothetical protein
MHPSPELTRHACPSSIAPPISDRLITPSQLALFSRSRVIGACDSVNLMALRLASHLGGRLLAV